LHQKQPGTKRAASTVLGLFITVYLGILMKISERSSENAKGTERRRDIIRRRK
jgi:hypothetical protein